MKAEGVMREAWKVIAQKPVMPLIRLLAKKRVSPNLLSFLSLPVSIIVGLFFSINQLVWAGIFLLLLGLLDTIDGAVARASERQHPLGAFFDSLVDRIAESVIFLGILILYLDNSFALILVFLTFATSFLVSYIRARAEGIGKECKTGIFERPVRIFCLIIGVFFFTKRFLPIILGLILLGNIITIIQRIDWVTKR